MKGKKLLALLLSVTVAMGGLLPVVAQADTMETTMMVGELEEAAELDEAEEQADDVEETDTLEETDENIDASETEEEESPLVEIPEAVEETEAVVEEAEESVETDELSDELGETVEVETEVEDLDLSWMESYDEEMVIMTELGEVPSYGYATESIDVYAMRSAATSGSYGTIKWAYNSGNRTLSLTGTGALNKNKTAFPWSSYQNSIEKIKIGQGITALGEAVFYEYYRLNTVEFPTTLKDIGTGAFADCASLSKVTLKEGLKTIGQYAFQQCPITEIKIPKSVKTVSPLAFYGCQKLNKLTVTAGHKKYSASKNILYNLEKTKLCLSVPANKDKNITIPSGVKTIGEAAFIRSPMTSVTIPNTVKTIEDSAFLETNLRTLKIPNSVKTAGDWFAYSNDYLTSVEIGSGLKRIEYQSFAYCGNLEKVTFANGVTQIGNGAFGECTSLKSVKLPASLKEIWYQAFLNCQQLTSITFPSKLEKIYSLSFWGTGIGKATIPANVKVVAYEAFSAAAKLTYQAKMIQAEDGSRVRATTLYVSVLENYQEAFAVLKIVNQERKKAGAPALKMDRELLATAMLRAAELTVYNYHERPSGLDCFSANGDMRGENIAAGYWDAESVMYGWMNSSGHRDNILTKDYKSIGIGCVKTDGGRYWVQVFGTANAKVAAADSYKNKTSEFKIITDVERADYAASISAQAVIGAGGSVKIKYYCYNGFAYEPVLAKSFSYVSSKPTIAKVDTSGKITGVKKGDVTFAAYPKGYTAVRARTTVKVTQGSQTISAADCSVAYGSAAVDLGAKLTRGVGKLSYKSSNNNIATVSAAGKITAKEVGTTTITITAAATADYKTATKQITVNVKPPKTILSNVTSTAKSKAVVTWEKNVKANGYQIQCSVNSDFQNGQTVIVEKKPTIKTTLKDLTSGKTYYVRVRAYKTVSGKMVFGAWSGKKSVQIK